MITLREDRQTHEMMKRKEQKEMEEIKQVIVTKMAK